MKKLKSLYLPAVIVLMGVGAALASHNSKSSDNALEPGYYFDSSASQCVATDVQCSSIPGEACTWTDESNTTHELSRSINSTMCGAPLYKP